MDILHPQEKEKSQRLLHTSAEFLQRMQHKSEFTAGIEKEEYDKEFRYGRQSPFVVPLKCAFSSSQFRFVPDDRVS